MTAPEPSPLTTLAPPSWPQDGCHSPWHNSHVQQGKHNAVRAISAPDIWKQSIDTWKTKVFHFKNVDSLGKREIGSC